MSEHVHLWQGVGTFTPPNGPTVETAGCSCGAHTEDPAVIATVKAWNRTSSTLSALRWELRKLSDETWEPTGPWVFS